MSRVSAEELAASGALALDTEAASDSCSSGVSVTGTWVSSSRPLVLELEARVHRGYVLLLEVASAAAVSLWARPKNDEMSAQPRGFFLGGGILLHDRSMDNLSKLQNKKSKLLLAPANCSLSSSHDRLAEVMIHHTVTSSHQPALCPVVPDTACSALHVLRGRYYTRTACCHAFISIMHTVLRV